MHKAFEDDLNNDFKNSYEMGHLRQDFYLVFIFIELYIKYHNLRTYVHF